MYADDILLICSVRKMRKKINIRFFSLIEVFCLTLVKLIYFSTNVFSKNNDVNLTWVALKLIVIIH